MKFNTILKAILDRIISFIAVLILWPVILIIAIIVKIDSKGPAFFKQERLGKHGKPYTMYKFRSMVVGAESMGAGLFNYRDDNRVTKVGRFLRDSSLDELPQIFNVLKGDISFVGPRSPVTYELGEYSKLNNRFKRRFEVMSGITGYAQVMGRNNNSWSEKVDLDNEYIDLFKKYGILIDIKILFLTVFNVIRNKDIYEERPDGDYDDEQAGELAQEEVIRMAQEPDEETVTL